MTPFERMKTLVEWNLSDNVDEENVNMFVHMNACGSGCRAGWGATCPALIQEGFSLSNNNPNLLLIDGEAAGYDSDNFLNFFGLTVTESRYFFSPVWDGTKEELMENWGKYLKKKEKISWRKRGINATQGATQ